VAVGHLERAGPLVRRSASHLRPAPREVHLPLRYLKIDRSFVLDLVRSRDDRRVVQSIIGIAEQFGLRTIAEGVEDAPMLDLLRELGADYAQGFHTGHPAWLPA
jgi:EAL domain-containing protein (putative c-di-GMP-specific phosphodiesterase class I)